MLKKTLGFAVSAILLGVALPAFAATAPTATQIACVGSAVNTREQSLDAGITTLTQAQNAAYSARAGALAQAYTLTSGNGAIRTAIRAAWTTFSAAMRTARTAWQKTRSTAWATFRTTVKACKAPAVATDSANSSLDASGQ